MTLREFKNKVPDFIEHFNWGIQYLETHSHTNNKMACYRGVNNLSSFGTYGNNWQEIFDKLTTALNESPLL
jgi:hypothetical protein